MKHFSWNTVAQLTGRLVSLLVSLFLAAVINRYWGLDHFGRYDIAATYVLFVAMLTELGFSAVAVRELSQADTFSERERRTGLLLTLRVGLALIFYPLSSLLLLLFPYDRPTLLLTLTMLLAAFLNSLVGVCQAIFQVEYRTWHNAIGDGLTRLLFLALIFSGAVLWSPGLLWIGAANLLATLCGAIYLYVQGRRYSALPFYLEWPRLRRYLQDTVLLGIGLFLGVLHSRIDTLLLAGLCGPHQVGLYALAYRLYEGGLVLPWILSGLLLPLMSHLAAVDRQRLVELFERGCRLTLPGALLLAISLFTLAPFLIFLLAAGRPIEGSVLTLRILLAIFPCLCLASLAGNLLIACGEGHRLIQLNLLGLLINIPLNLLLIPRFSFPAAALVTVISEGAVFIWLWLRIRQIIGRPFLRSIFRQTWPLTAALLFCACLWFHFQPQAMLYDSAWSPAQRLSLSLAAILDWLIPAGICYWIFQRRALRGLLQAVETIPSSTTFTSPGKGL